MDLYTRTALTNTRHQDLLNEAANDRLTGDARAADITSAVRSVGGSLIGRIAAVTHQVRTARTSPRKAAAHS